MPDPRKTLARIRAQAAAATDGPWAPWKAQGSTHWEVLGDCDDYGNPALIAAEVDSEDAEFIAAAPTTVPALLDALEAVLELHKPIQASMTTNSGVIDTTVCAHCLDPTWPCQTVAAITTACAVIPTDTLVDPLDDHHPAVQAAARAALAEGWTCDTHEPLPWGECRDCTESHLRTARRALTAALPHLTAATRDAGPPEPLPCGCENPLNAVHLLDH